MRNHLTLAARGIKPYSDGFREGRDERMITHELNQTVSIHAPREGRDQPPTPTRAARRCFNPRAPRGARPAAHADTRGAPMFQSTRPARGATPWHSRAETGQNVSIHAPREGRDTSLAANHLLDTVSIHAPREGRDRRNDAQFSSLMFQSTRPARGATCNSFISNSNFLFQSTRPARGATFRFRLCQFLGCFNPRAPRGARRARQCFGESQ